ncbi:MAG: tetratricopeptide repeat protein [Bacteroides sp.]|nr:tetratricopeptide repeat protein [Bacteroides sp.]
MKPGIIHRFIQELKRRRVFRGIIYYGASTLILLESADIIANAIGYDGAPPWFIWVLGVGFIGSLFFSWIYDFTPDGIRKTEPFDGQRVHIPRKEVRLYQTTTFVSVMIIIVLLSYNIIDGANKKKIQALEKAIAVIPVATGDLSYDEFQHFDFIGEQITSCLLKVKDCHVKPWEECRNYRRGDKPYPEIGNDLSAAILVDLSPYENQARKNLFVNLILASNGKLLMSESLEIDGTWEEEICKHSREISKKIAKRLRIYLTREERTTIDERNVSSRASLFFSYGKKMTRDAMDMAQIGAGATDNNTRYYDSISFDRAINYFTEAIKEEPTFAEAYANRAKARLWGIRSRYYDTSYLEECRRDIEKAFDLDPDLPDAYVAMGFYHYFGTGNYTEALSSFEKAIEQNPDSNEYLFYMAKISTELGNWEDVRVLADKVFESNPLDALFLTNLGLSYHFLGDFTKAIECHDRAIKLAPRWYAPYINKINSLLSMGEISVARSVAREARVNTGKDYSRILAELDLYEGNYSSAVRHIERDREEDINSQANFERDELLVKAEIYKYALKPLQAREYYSLAEQYYSDQIKFDTEDYRSYSKLGIAYAGLGQVQMAIESGQKGLELAKIEYSAVLYPDILYNMAQTYALAGDYTSALLILKELMATISPYTSEFIKLDPEMKHLLDVSDL